MDERAKDKSKSFLVINIVITDVKIINYVKAHALNPCLFQQLCKEMGAEHKRLLLSSEIR